MKTQPALTWGAIVALIEAIIVGGVVLGWWSLDTKETAALMTIVVAAIAVIAPIVGGILTARQSTSLVDPKDVDGTPLVRSDGMPPMRSALAKE